MGSENQVPGRALAWSQNHRHTGLHQEALHSTAPGMQAGCLNGANEGLLHQRPQQGREWLGWRLPWSGQGHDSRM